MIIVFYLFLFLLADSGHDLLTETHAPLDNVVTDHYVHALQTHTDFVSWQYWMIAFYVIVEVHFQRDVFDYLRGGTRLIGFVIGKMVEGKDLHIAQKEVVRII